MADGRHFYLKWGSRRTGITDELRDLVRNMRHAENVDEWMRGPGIGEPTIIQPWSPNYGQDLDDDQTLPMKYYPHKGEDGEAWRNPPDFEAPLVLLVQRVKPLKKAVRGRRTKVGIPWWELEILEKLGLGRYSWEGKRVAVPNMTLFTSQLYKVKHLVKITPVRFPNGVPTLEAFDPQMVKITHDGQFIYHPRVKARNVALASGPAPQPLAIQKATHQRQSLTDFNSYHGSPFGNHNYHRNTNLQHPDKTNFKTDCANPTTRYDP